jgi:hypothetical protein
MRRFLIYILQVTLAGLTYISGGSNFTLFFSHGLNSLPGVLPLFNGLPLTFGIFFTSKKGFLGGKYLSQLPKHQHPLLARDVFFHDGFF